MDSSNMPMVLIAIEVAKFHGINLHHGVPNLANGDCVIEAVADNITTSPCYSETYSKDATYNRKAWLSEAAEVVFEFCGVSKETFDLEWGKLMQPRYYECPLGDFVLPAIAHCTRKDILIFNSNADGPFDPINVVQASKIGNIPASTEIPVLLAYNGVHYEGLVPDSAEDEEKTVILKNSYLSGDYTLQKKDIPVFKTESESTVGKQTYASTVKGTLQDQTKYTPATIESEYFAKKPKITHQQTMKGLILDEFPLKDDEKKVNVHCNDICSLKQCQKEGWQVQTKRKKDMSKDELREYNRLKKKESRERAKICTIENCQNDNKQQNCIEQGQKEQLQGLTNRKKNMSQNELKEYNRSKKKESREKANNLSMTNSQNENNQKRVSPNMATFEKRKTIADMSVLELRNYNRLKKTESRSAERLKDPIAFKKKIATEKNNERIIKRSENEKVFKKKTATEKANSRLAKRIKNETTFKKKRATEKSNERVTKRSKDETVFK